MPLIFIHEEQTYYIECNIAGCFNNFHPIRPEDRLIKTVEYAKSYGWSLCGVNGYLCPFHTLKR